MILLVLLQSLIQGGILIFIYNGQENWISALPLMSEGAIPDAVHIYLPHLTENLDRLDRSQPIATYCGSGYRSSIAASLLQKYDFESVINIPGSGRTWRSVDLPFEQPAPSQVG
jgi:3-mercaptopyruvate sulfurtransferase SseA